ncbi:MBL fold metallo-hydrolase [Limibacillus halophilus]|uniref:Phosphoribosyl 1,2-cyclic phosphate phosphodiesterase n=1 Tax=Limibacillus halophilus TaxID=1579333 RepID=A0A839SXB4_9PROT|nr:MBL fold metallo-hydrolase [Limibacillus halophilus]MBB3065645.1 phosphoribosyl 1,2-cyclic phosphate phosphodiesterase [Limibacillus halophilus]
MKITVLGCGSSGGVPLINGTWGNCNPNNPRNRRRRASILVENASRRILIDTSPDLRLQMLDASVDSLDAVLFTHDHADHCHGLDDLRAFAFHQGPIPAYMSEETQNCLAQRFGYALKSQSSATGLYRAILDDRIIDRKAFDVAGTAVRPFVQDHGLGQTTLGFRIGGFAYSTDLVDLPDASWKVLSNLDLWIVDCLQIKPHPTHSHLEKTLRWIEKIQPQKTILTHMNHSLDYDWLIRNCPEGVQPGYDGLTIDL